MRAMKSAVARMLGQYRVALVKSIVLPQFKHRCTWDVIYKKFDDDVNVIIKSNLSRKLARRVNEKDMHWAIKKLVKPGDVCVDVGANVGEASFLLSKSVGPEGRVIAFEPFSNNFVHLLQNIKINKRYANSILPFKLGVGEEAGSVNIVESEHSPGSPFVNLDGGLMSPTKVMAQESISIVSLDEFLPALGVNKVNFIKVDVDGFEYFVFAGAKKIIEKYRPVIFFESHVDLENPEAMNNQYLSKVTTQLYDLGYKTYKIDSDGSFVPTQFPELGKNTLAIPN